MARLNLHLLRAFAAVVAHGGFGRAAEALHVSQPAISKAVRELESQLDLPLLDRGSKRVRLTEAGEILYDHARRIFAVEKSALANLNALRHLEAGRLTIGASMTIATYLLPPLLARFLAVNPGVDVRVVTGNTDAVTERLVDYELDLALVGSPVHDARVQSKHWYDHTLVIIAPRTHRLIQRGDLTAADFQGERWIVREQGSGTRLFAARVLEDVGIRIERMLEVDSVDGLVQSVAVGLGLAVVPEEAAEDLVAVGKLAILGAGQYRFPWPLYGMRLRERTASTAVRRFGALAGLDDLFVVPAA